MNSTRPFIRRVAALGLSGTLLLGAGCDLIDPTSVTNPNITENTALELPALGGPWLNGLQRQLVLVYNSALPELELASDNYVNTNNFYLADDRLDFLNDQHPTVQELQFYIADLRESAEFGLTEVRARDAGLTATQLSEFYFYKGYAHLAAAMYFKTLPAGDGGVAVPSAEHYRLAIEAFDAALAAGGSAANVPSYHLAKARAHFYLGERPEALAAANAAIAADADYVRFVHFDPINTTALEPTDSAIENAIWERSTTDLQPLPRLDFLDPKFNDYGSSTTDAAVPMFKIEEAYLIKAQAELAASDLAAAKATMKDVIALVATRPLATIEDTDKRTSRAPNTRPNTAEWKVKRTPSQAAEAGLVLTRSAGTQIAVPTISGTSVTADQVDAAASVDAALEVLYLLRQEIFMAEGLRFVDLGLKMPVHEEEALTNANITAEDRQGQIPSFLPRGEFDDATLDFDARLATIKHDLNAILVANKSSDLVVPFF